MTLRDVQLDDKYTLNDGQVYLTGTQALVRLPLLQKARDLQAGLNTAGFISGYRGSPLGYLDKQLWAAQSHLDAAEITFKSGLNEDMAATAVWGTQQVNLYPAAKYDGVFGMWYGKGPGVDRSGDVLKHANAAGTSPFGGVLAIAGDDHNAKSSTLPHQTEYAFVDAMIPVLNPAGVQEILDFGQIGWALSRYCGCWVALKTIAETIDSSASVTLDNQRPDIQIPDAFQLPAGGLNIRWPHPPLQQEALLHQHRLYAALEFCRLNQLNQIVLDSPRARLGIVTTGKSYLDLMQALEDLGIGEQLAAQIGLRVYKIAMTWPLEPEGVKQFADGLDEILVVEEKRALIENQLKEQLYNWSQDIRPRVVGKFDEHRNWLLSSLSELTPAMIARVIARRIKHYFASETIEARLRFLDEKEAELIKRQTGLERLPHFCSGCPHNTSTQLPEGSRASAGIGCHYMAIWMDRETSTFTQMGGEGVPWIGQAPFTRTPHIFANLGDGTYFHSGILAIRAALAVNINITYKILYNDAVAMTGGQLVDGQLDVARLTRQLAAEGVEHIALVSDDLNPFKKNKNLAPQVKLYPRETLDALQKDFRALQGVSVIVYAQTCATEKRRRWKRGTLEKLAVRPYIHTELCENCGDCSSASNCLSVIPVNTPLGRKRAIDQSACNKDFSCVQGLCPSFITIHGGSFKLKNAPSAETAAINPSHLPEPTLPALETPYNVLLTGVGGTGIVTIGALLGMAAHLDHRGVTVLDMTGLAQKYGAVVSHVRIGKSADSLHAPRIAAGKADALLAFDLAVASSSDALAKMDSENTRGVINEHPTVTSAFIHDRDITFPHAELTRQLSNSTLSADFIDATKIAESLLQDAIYSNLLLLGYAWQKGLLPVSQAALLKALALNGVAVEANTAAFYWGRKIAAEPKSVDIVNPNNSVETVVPQSLQELIAHRYQLLSKYQNKKLADKYQQRIQQLQSQEEQLGKSGLAFVVAQHYARLLAYKDEYEVARQLSSEQLQHSLSEQFNGDYQIRLHLAPPFLPSPNQRVTRPQKREFGQWILPLMKLLGKLKFLRGTLFDPFSYTQDRKLERQLIANYEMLINQLSENLTADNYKAAVETAGLIGLVRGYGEIKKSAAVQYYQTLESRGYQTQ